MASESSEPPKSESPPPPKQEEPKEEKKEASANEEPDPTGGPKEKPAEQGRQPTKGTTSALATPADQTKYGAGNAGTDAQKAPEKPGQGEKPKFFASPLARKIALERGIPLGQIKGTGPEGRIVKVSSDPGAPTILLHRQREHAYTSFRMTWKNTKEVLEVPPVLLLQLLPLLPAQLLYQAKLLPLRLRPITRMYQSAVCGRQSENGYWRASSNCHITTLPSKSIWVSRLCTQWIQADGG